MTYEQQFNQLYSEAQDSRERYDHTHGYHDNSTGINLREAYNNIAHVTDAEFNEIFAQVFDCDMQ